MKNQYTFWNLNYYEETMKKNIYNLASILEALFFKDFFYSKIIVISLV